MVAKRKTLKTRAPPPEPSMSGSGIQPPNSRAFRCSASVRSFVLTAPQCDTATDGDGTTIAYTGDASSRGRRRATYAEQTDAIETIKRKVPIVVSMLDEGEHLTELKVEQCMV